MSLQTSIGALSESIVHVHMHTFYSKIVKHCSHVCPRWPPGRARWPDCSNHFYCSKYVQRPPLPGPALHHPASPARNIFYDPIAHLITTAGVSIYLGSLHVHIIHPWITESLYVNFTMMLTYSHVTGFITSSHCCISPMLYWQWQ